MKHTLKDAVNKKDSKLPNDGHINYGDLTGNKIRNIVNNICSNFDIRYLEIGLYRGGIFSAALHKNKIDAVGIDNWSQNWLSQDSRSVFMERLEESRGENSVEIIENSCWEPNLLGDKKFNVYTFDGPHGWQDQYDALVKYIDNMDDKFIYIVDDYDEEKSPEVVDAVQRSIIDLDLEIEESYTFRAGPGYHEGVYFASLSKKLFPLDMEVE